jgi:hypothetical protein
MGYMLYTAAEGGGPTPRMRNVPKVVRSVLYMWAANGACDTAASHSALRPDSAFIASRRRLSSSRAAWVWDGATSTTLGGTRRGSRPRVRHRAPQGAPTSPQALLLQLKAPQPHLEQAPGPSHSSGAPSGVRSAAQSQFGRGARHGCGCGATRPRQDDALGVRARRGRARPQPCHRRAARGASPRSATACSEIWGDVGRCREM